MKIIIVEPHADDAFLSLGWHIEHLWRSPEYDKLILTVFTGKSREQEAHAYAVAIGARSIVLGLPESRMDAGGRPKVLPALREALRTELGFTESMELQAPSGTLVLFPLGLQHPDHLCVAATRIPGCMRYLDTPYQTKQKLAKELQDKSEGMCLYSLCYPGKRKWRHAPIFKSQAKFFHFNDLTNAHVPETILYHPVW